MGGPDKSTSLCYSCNMIGHWAGDPKCPLTIGNQPPPPGTGPNNQLLSPTYVIVYTRIVFFESTSKTLNKLKLSIKSLTKLIAVYNYCVYNLNFFSQTCIKSKQEQRVSKNGLTQLKYFVPKIILINLNSFLSFSFLHSHV